MPDATLVVPAFVITELEGRRRILTLTARALPFRPVGFGARKQRVHIERYQGTRRGTSTVLGPDLSPTKVNGEWKEKYLSPGVATVGTPRSGTASAKVDGASITSAVELKELVDSIVDAGARLEVRWFREVRQGHLTEFDVQWQNVNDLIWEMSFEWTDTGTPDAGPPVRSPADTSAVGTQLGSAINEMQNTLDGSRNALAPDRLAQVEDALAQVEQSVAQLQGGVDTAVSTAMRPIDATRRAVSSLSGVVGQATFIAREALSTPPLEMLSIATRVDPTTIGMGQRAAAALLQDEVTRGARRQQRLASIARADLLREMQDDLIGVHTAVEGENLRDVSQGYYGSPGGWRDLMQFNHLTDASLVRGQVVLVPRLGNGAGAGG